ncbi:MAG: nucleotidyltransferase family protein [Polyangia bacterium]
MDSPKTERELLAAVVAAVLRPERTAELPGGDNQRLLAVARRHRLTPLLSLAYGNRLPAELREAVRHDRILTTARNMALTHAGQHVVQAFASAGVATIVLKGLDYETRLYGAAGARPTADIDLLVRQADRRRAFAVLDRLKFEPRAAAAGFDEPDYHEVAWAGDGVEVDLHMGLAPVARCGIDYDAVWAQAEPARLGNADTLVLSRPHAAVFQALHMAIDHFDVPAVYLIDLSRLLPQPDDFARAAQVARSWRCLRPLVTAATLTAAFAGGALADALPPASWMTRQVVTQYGGVAPLARPAQLLRKMAHFDSAVDAGRYTLVQARRNLREQFETRIRRRSARDRLSLADSDAG